MFDEFEQQGSEFAALEDEVDGEEAEGLDDDEEEADDDEEVETE